MNNTSFNKDLMLASGIFKNNQELGKQLNILLYNHNTSTTPVSDKSIKKLTHNQKKINPTIDYLSSIIGESVPSSIFNLAINSNIAFSDFQHFSAFNTKQNSEIQTRYQSLYSRFEELSPWKKFKFQMLFKRSLLTLESLAIGSYETLFATEYREIPEINAQVEGVSRLLDRFTQEHSKYQSYKDVEYKEDKRLKSKDVGTFYSLLTLFSYIDFPEIPIDLEELFLDSYPLKTLFSEDKEYTRFSSYQRFVIVKFRLLMLSIAVEESLYNIIFQEPCSDFASIFDKNTTSGNSLLVDLYLNLFSLDTVYQLTKLFNFKANDPASERATWSRINQYKRYFSFKRELSSRATEYAQEENFPLGALIFSFTERVASDFHNFIYRYTNQVGEENLPIEVFRSRMSDYSKLKKICDDTFKKLNPIFRNS